MKEEPETTPPRRRFIDLLLGTSLGATLLATFYPIVRFLVAVSGNSWAGTKARHRKVAIRYMPSNGSSHPKRLVSAAPSFIGLFIVFRNPPAIGNL